MVRWLGGEELKMVGVNSVHLERVVGVVPKAGFGGGERGVGRVAFNVWGWVVDLKGCQICINWDVEYGVFSNWMFGGFVAHAGWSRSIARLGLRARAGPQAHVGEVVENGAATGAAELGRPREGRLDYEQQFGDAVEGVTGLDASLAVAVGCPEGGDSAIRFSRRLVAKEASLILGKAVAVKARRGELEGCGGGQRLYLNRKKIKTRSAKCGVLLDEGETNSFMEFVSRKV